MTGPRPTFGRFRFAKSSRIRSWISRTGVPEWTLPLTDKIRWNISSKRKLFTEADLLIVSIPKSGRTWLHIFLSKYLSDAAGIPFSLDLSPKTVSSGPSVYLTHDRWEHRTARYLWEQLRGKFLIPRGRCPNALVLLLVRDPRDVAVSLYLHLNRRGKIFPGEISEMIRSPKYGVRPMIRIMNEWLGEFRLSNRLEIFRYEDFRNAPEPEFHRLLKVTGIPVDPDRIRKSIEFSSFDRMKEMERNRLFPNSFLSTDTPDDPESFKVRRGRVGGHRDYLGSEDLNYIHQEMRALSPEFGYQGEEKNSLSPPLHTDAARP